MPVVIFTMLVILVLAAAIIAVVVMGMEGQGRQQHPGVADAMARTARHLNGESDPPPALVALLGEMDDVSVTDVDVRQLPGRLRSRLSARSADSAESSDSPGSVASGGTPASAASTVTGPSPSSPLTATPGEDAAGRGAAGAQESAVPSTSDRPPAPAPDAAAAAPRVLHAELPSEPRRA